MWFRCSVFLAALIVVVFTETEPPPLGNTVLAAHVTGANGSHGEITNKRVPSIVRSLVIEKSSDEKSVIFKWKKPQEFSADTKYEIFYKIIGTGKAMKRIDSTTKESYVFKKVKSGESYKFGVRATNKAGSSKTIESSIISFGSGGEIIIANAAESQHIESAAYKKVEKVIKFKNAISKDVGIKIYHNGNLLTSSSKVVSKWGKDYKEVTVTLFDVQRSDSGNYSVSFEGASKLAEVKFTLTIIQAPSIPGQRGYLTGVKRYQYTIRWKGSKDDGGSAILYYRVYYQKMSEYKKNITMTKYRDTKEAHMTFKYTPDLDMVYRVYAKNKIAYSSSLTIFVTASFLNKSLPACGADDKVLACSKKRMDSLKSKVEHCVKSLVDTLEIEHLKPKAICKELKTCSEHYTLVNCPINDENVFKDLVVSFFSYARLLAVKITEKVKGKVPENIERDVECMKSLDEKNIAGCDEQFFGYIKQTYKGYPSKTTKRVRKKLVICILPKLKKCTRSLIGIIVDYISEANDYLDYIDCPQLETTPGTEPTDGIDQSPPSDYTGDGTGPGDTGDTGEWTSTGGDDKRTTKLIYQGFRDRNTGECICPTFPPAQF